MERKVRTIAFQVDDPEFIQQYENRQKESGMKVRDYFINLVKADITLHQVQESEPLQESGEALEPEQRAALVDAVLSELLPDEPEQERGSNAFEPEDISEQPEDAYPDQDIAEAETEEPIAEQEQADDPAPEEMMNLFVKITKAQREALETHKLETGEIVGSVMNRLIDSFLDNTDSLPEGFEYAYSRYLADIKACDTTCSARIPARVNQELTDYLSSFGGSRNALMSALVELELNGQTMSETQEQGAEMQAM